MTEPLDEVRFWSQVLTDAQRTVVCSPELESRVKGWVDSRMMGGLIKVVPQRFCPDDVIYVIDENASAAALAEDLNKWRRVW